MILDYPDHTLLFPKKGGNSDAVSVQTDTVPGFLLFLFQTLYNSALFGCSLPDCGTDFPTLPAVKEYLLRTHKIFQKNPTSDIHPEYDSWRSSVRSRSHPVL